MDTFQVGQTMSEVLAAWAHPTLFIRISRIRKQSQGVHIVKNLLGWKSLEKQEQRHPCPHLPMLKKKMLLWCRYFKYQKVVQIAFTLLYITYQTLIYHWLPLQRLLFFFIMRTLGSLKTNWIGVIMFNWKSKEKILARLNWKERRKKKKSWTRQKRWTKTVSTIKRNLEVTKVLNLG